MIQQCPHDVLYYGVCAKCGEKRKGDQLEGCTHIKSDEKIALVLDLDHTLVHSVSTESIEQMYDVKSDEFHAMVRTSKDLYHNKAVQSWIKVRPGTREMLRDLKNTYKIYIYTMGTRPYAEEVKKILDPDGDIFGNRVLSRCDTPGFHFKLLSKLKLHDDNALIIDDTPEVWKRHRRNLLQIERYMYFPVTKGGDCYFSRGQDEIGDRNNLAFIHKALERVDNAHVQRTDCRDTLERLKKKVLSGYRIHIDPKVHTGFKDMATEMGALLSHNVKRVTHYVTVDGPSQEASRDVKVVKPKWILYCYMFMYNVPCV
jgi:RNA polymerase II C-terminal domain phosphatase-like 3/4